MNCPLCKNSTLETLETLSVRDIIKDYLKKFRVNVRSSFQNHKTLNYLRCKECDLRFFDPIIAGDEVFYEQFQKFDWYYPEEKNEFSFAARFIRPTDTVLEVGSGKGAFTKYIKYKSYTGLEFSKNAIELARKNGITIINKSVEEFSKNNLASQDVVCHFQVLEHVKKPAEFLQSCIAALKPGGRLIISVPSYDSFSKNVSNFELDLPPHHVTRWSDQSIQKISTLYGLELQELWHEPLQETHKVFFTQTLIASCLRHILFKKFRTVDMSIAEQLIQRTSGLIVRSFKLERSIPTLYPRGISLTAVYVKS